MVFRRCRPADSAHDVHGSWPRAVSEAAQCRGRFAQGGTALGSMPRTRAAGASCSPSSGVGGGVQLSASAGGIGANSRNWIRLALERLEQLRVGRLDLGEDLLELVADQLVALDQRLREVVDGRLLLVQEAVGLLVQLVEQLVRGDDDRPDRRLVRLHRDDDLGRAHRQAADVVLGGQRRAHAGRSTARSRACRGTAFSTTWPASDTMICVSIERAYSDVRSSRGRCWT